MDFSEKVVAFIFVFLFAGLGFFIYDAVTSKANCIQAAMSKDYSADEIQKICR